LELSLKSLVVYYTRSGNARFVAETVAAYLGADIEEVIDKKNRGGPLGFLNGGRDARAGKETEIEPAKKSPCDYDLIVVGTPIWAGKPTPAINTYLKHNDLSGRKVAAFFVQGGKKPQGIEEVKALLPNSSYAGEISIINATKNKPETENQLAEWCKTLTPA
jgi:flavodoxin